MVEQPAPSNIGWGVYGRAFSTIVYCLTPKQVARWWQLWHEFLRIQKHNEHTGMNVDAVN